MTLKVLGLLILLSFNFAMAGLSEEDIFNSRSTDDSKESSKAMDIFHRGGTTLDHIKELSIDPISYLRFLNLLASDVKHFGDPSLHLWGQRSLTADMLAIMVGRNFVTSTEARIDIQNVIDQGTEKLSKSLLESDRAIKLNLYSSIMSALQFSSRLNDSFYRRALTWSLRISHRERSSFFSNWLANNAGKELNYFLAKFSSKNQNFLRDLIHSNPHIAPDQWEILFSTAKIRIEFSIEKQIAFAKNATLSSNKNLCRKALGSAE